MELKINSQFIAAQREKRAWSQQHLADAAGLALRTIQRIETRGTGSYESLKALASCLEVSAEALRIEQEQRATSQIAPSRRVRVAGSIVGTSLLAGIAGLLWLGTASAKQVLIDLGMTVEKSVVSKDSKPGKDVHNLQTQLLLGDGENKELPVEGKFNLVLTPTILEDGRVLLAAKLYEQRDSGLQLVGEPRMVAADGKETEVVLSAGEGPERTYRITFKPKIQ